MISSEPAHAAFVPVAPGTMSFFGAAVHRERRFLRRQSLTAVLESPSRHAPRTGPGRCPILGDKPDRYSSHGARCILRPVRADRSALLVDDQLRCSRQLEEFAHRAMISRTSGRRPSTEGYADHQER